MKIQIDQDKILNLIDTIDVIKGELVNLLKLEDAEFDSGDMVVAYSNGAREWLIFIAKDDGNSSKPYVCRRLDKDGQLTGECENYKEIRTMTDDELKLLPQTVSQ